MMTRLKSLLFIFILVVLYAIYYWIVPIAVNIESRIAKIEQNVKNELGLQVKIEKPHLKMGLIPSIWLDAKSFSILGNEAKSPFSIENPKIKIRLFPLLFGKINLAYISGDNFFANIKFDKNYRFYIGNHLIFENSNPRINIENSKMNLNGYNIFIKDELQNKNIELKGDYLKLDKFNSKKQLKLSVDSTIKVNDRSSIINADIDLKLPLKKNFKQDDVLVDGTLTNFNLADFSPYIKKFSHNEIIKTSGLINIEAKTINVNQRTDRIIAQAVIDNLSLVTNDKISSIIFNDRLNIFSILDISKNTLKINKLTLKSGRINSQISGEIDKMTAKSPIYNLNLIINNSRLEDFIKLIPVNASGIDEINLVALKKYGFFSDINGNLNIKGKANNLDLKGKFDLFNAYVSAPLPSAIPKAKIDISFLSNKINMDINVPLSKTENVSIKGFADLYGKNHIDIYVNSTQNADLKTAQKILIPVHEIFQFELGPLPVMDLNGTGNIKLHIKGSKIAPRTFGIFNIKNANASFNGIDMRLTNSYGRLIFDDNNTKLILDKVLLNSKPIKASGTCTLSGVLDYDIIANSQDLGNLYTILNNSPVLSDISKVLPPLKSASGKTDLKLKLTGKVKNLYDVKFGKTIFAEGKLKLYGNDLIAEQLALPIKNIVGEVKFKNTDLKLETQSLLNQSIIKTTGTVQGRNANLTIYSKKLKLSDILNSLNKSNSSNLKILPSFSNTSLDLLAKYNGSINKFDIKKASIFAKILPENFKNSDLWLNSGNIELKNGTLKFTKINGTFNNNQFEAFASAENFLSKNQRINGYFVADKFDISSFKLLKQFPFIPKNFRKNIESFDDLNGKINLKIYAKNNNYSSKISIDDINFVYMPMEMPLKFFSGNIDFKNDKINLHKVNAVVDSMPVLLDGTVANVFKTPIFDVYVNSKPNQKFIDKYVNKNAIYPLKIKGDINYSSRIKGTPDLFSAKTEINLQEDSNIYYMGSTIGDANDPIRLFLDTTVSKKFIEVSNFQYEKMVSSQNNKSFTMPQLTAKGLIGVNKDKITLYKFTVKTQNPTDAKVFNLLFKKPVIKQGLFTSDITINGLISEPKIIGNLNFSGIDIPIFDTTVKDISLDFSDKNIDIKSKGEIFSNKLVVTSTMNNKLTPPYRIENLDIYCQNLDINSVTNSLNSILIKDDKYKLTGAKMDFDLSNIIIEKASLKADTIRVKAINAQNFSANLNLSEKMILALSNFKFDLAEGNVKGNFKYNLLNSNSSLDMSVNGVNANSVSEALFDLKNQIFGSLTGEIDLSCNGKSHKTCMETLSGNGGFQVANGRMPKLGSLEYLLKASNLIKSGVTGLSINGIIDLVTPLKTGQFESIRGDFNIKSGIADSIQIFSKGKDLSLFITGTYNFATVIADLSVFGRLSKKITNALGPVGNLSLNTLFNTIPGLDLDETNKAEIIKKFDRIPGLEFNEKLYRIFSVKIYGDINGENYVQSFRWVE